MSTEKITFGLYDASKQKPMQFAEMTPEAARTANEARDRLGLLGRWTNVEEQLKAAHEQNQAKHTEG